MGSLCLRGIAADSDAGVFVLPCRILGRDDLKEYSGVINGPVTLSVLDQNEIQFLDKELPLQHGGHAVRSCAMRLTRMDHVRSVSIRDREPSLTESFTGRLIGRRAPDGRWRAYTQPIQGWFEPSRRSRTRPEI
jgi:hypothetical protein